MNVRAAEERDLPEINDVYNHYVRTSPATFDLDEVTMDARSTWFTQFRLHGRHPLFVAVDGGELLGYAYSGEFRERRAYETSISVSAYCHPDATGKGVGSALYAALFEAISGEDVHRAYAGITVPNAASFALHERFEFKQVAYFTEQGRKFDRYWDVAWLEKHL
jgi:phosphinothricin acetyltransferase